MMEAIIGAALFLGGYCVGYYDGFGHAKEKIVAVLKRRLG